MKPARVRAVVFFALAGAGAIGAAASCSLGLDESKIAAANEAGGSDTAVDETGAADGGEGGPGPGSSDAATCTKDDDCATTRGCLKGKCDLSRKTCVYDVCREAACKAGACDVDAGTCGASKDYKYQAGQFEIGAPLTVRNGAVVVYPWLVALTPNGAVAFDVSDPTSGSPRSVPIVGLGFVPSQIVASGNRIYFLTGESGPRLPIAWIDAPSDPFATKIPVTTVLATYSRSETPSMFARGDDSALLVGPQPSNYASAIAQAPLIEPVSLTATPIVFTPGTGPAAVSGSRLLMQSVSGQAIASFGLIEGAGTTAPMNTGMTTFSDAGPISGPQAFGQSPEGAVFWAIASLTRAPGDPNNPPQTRAVRGYFLFPDGKGGLNDSLGIDVEVYGGGIGQGANVTGPTAMLDANTAIVLTAAKENPGSATAVQFVKREPLTVVKSRVVLPVSLGNFVAAAGSNGIGYAVQNVPAQNASPPNAMVYVFDPACAP